MDYKKKIDLLTQSSQASQEIELRDDADRFRLTMTIQGSQIYEDGGWICEKIERRAGVFLGKEKLMKVEGKENCRVLFHLIFLMKCSSIILSKIIEVSYFRWIFNIFLFSLCCQNSYRKSLLEQFYRNFYQI